MLPRSLCYFLAGLLPNLIQADTQQTVLELENGPRHLDFTLRHVHALTKDNRNIFADVSEVSLQNIQHHRAKLKARVITSHRPKYVYGLGGESAFVGWEDEPVLGPDVQDRTTLLELAMMTNNAYVEEGDKDWYRLPNEWDDTPFGWEPDADGFRGHIFASHDNSSVVLTIKGTSPAVFGGGGPTGRKDKLNDNLLFSCCCARVGPTWSPVCDCYRGGSKCEWDCLEQSLIKKSLFYSIGTNLYNNLTYFYPDANIWVTGHSLGGALASLLGVTFGAPVVAFESPGEAMAAQRLHLPKPPSTHHITHVYHNADPIPQGTCTGIFSSCSMTGYAMETSCHLGKSLVFDTVHELGWAVDVRTHGIKMVIDKILSEAGDWFPKNDSITGSFEGERGLPEAIAEGDCLEQECYAWEYV